MPGFSRQPPTPPTAAPRAGRRVYAAAPAELVWLQPYPDSLLDPPAPSDDEPDAALVAKETIELAFLAAIQHLPARQRAVLILRDVLGWSASDTAALLGVSVAAVKSALQRARPTLKLHLPAQRLEWAASPATTAQERSLLERYMSAHERADPSLMTAILRHDVLLTMPPHAMWFAGREAVVSFTAQVFDPASQLYHGQWRSLATWANRQPAAAQYVRLPGESAFRAQVLDVLRIEGDSIVEITAFEPHLFAAFGLPMTL